MCVHYIDPTLCQMSIRLIFVILSQVLHYESFFKNEYCGRPTKANVSLLKIKYPLVSQLFLLVCRSFVYMKIDKCLCKMSLLKKISKKV